MDTEHYIFFIFIYLFTIYLLNYYLYIFFLKAGVFIIPASHTKKKSYKGNLTFSGLL